MGVVSAAKPSILLFSRSSDRPPFLEPLHHALTGARDLDYHLVAAGSEIPALVRAASRAVIFVNCLLKEDIADLYNLLPGLSARVEEGTLKILVLNSIGHPRLGSLLRSRAAIEIVEMPTTLKAVQYKLKNALVTVHQAYQRAAQLRAKADPETVVDPALGTKTRAARAKPKAAGQEVLWQSPVEFNFDTWWIPGRKNIRNVVGVWLIDLVGPGPVVGVWEEIPGVERAGEKAWTWRPRAIAEDVFRTPDGRWIFFGKQPEFSWQKNLWSFVSKQPMFAYYPGDADSPEYVRFEYRPEEGLLFLENSAFTQALLGRIQATFESRLGGRTGEPAAEEPAEGALDGWDFHVEDETSGRKLESGAGDGSGAADWKDHTGAQGFDFRAKDLRVETRGPKSRGMRNALTPDPASAASLGLAPIDTPGVSAGGDAFDRVEVKVVALRKNGEILADSPEILVYEVNEGGATLLVRQVGSRLADRFVLRFSLDAGDSKMECLMEWEVTGIDLTLDDGTLMSGLFRAGDFDPLFTLLDRFEARKKELRAFYRTARG